MNMKPFGPRIPPEALAPLSSPLVLGDIMIHKDSGKDIPCSKHLPWFLVSGLPYAIRSFEVRVAPSVQLGVYLGVTQVPQRAQKSQALWDM